MKWEANRSFINENIYLKYRIFVLLVYLYLLYATLNY